MVLSRREFAIGLAAAGLLLPRQGRAGDERQAAPAAATAVDSRDTLDIVTERGRFTLKVEVVDTPEARRQGLMGRTQLAADAGMLFDYRTAQQVTMWMKNTPISLDMIFIAGDGRVVRVADHTEPYSEALIPSFQPVLAVLEVAAGSADRLGISPGSRVIHPIFPGKAR